MTDDNQGASAQELAAADEAQQYLEAVDALFSTAIGNVLNKLAAADGDMRLLAFCTALAPIRIAIAPTKVLRQFFSDGSDCHDTVIASAEQLDSIVGRLYGIYTNLWCALAEDGKQTIALPEKYRKTENAMAAILRDANAKGGGQG